MNKQQDTIFFSMIFVLLYNVFCASAQQALDKAHAGFMQGRTAAQALELYQQVEPKTVSIWYNMAQCYAQLSRYEYGLICLKRATAIASITQLGLLLEQEQNMYKKLSMPYPFRYYFFIKGAVLTIPLLLVQIILVILLLWMVIVLVYAYRRQTAFTAYKKKLYILIILIFSCLGLWYVHRKIIDQREAIVIENKVVVYAGPDATFHSVAQLPLGRSVKILQKDNNMYKITTQSIYGWVPIEAVELVYKS